MLIRREADRRAPARRRGRRRGHRGADAALPREPVHVRREPTSGAGETILLVEDDTQVREIVRHMLEANGYRVLAAGNGDEALVLVAGELPPIDLLLTDLIMPGPGGKEIADALRQLQPDITVLYMSGYTDDNVVRRGVLSEGFAFLQKPFGSDELGRRTRELLDARGTVASA